MNVIDRLRDVDVQDTDGQKVRLGDLWQEQPIVLVFVRHFGWGRGVAHEVHRGDSALGNGGLGRLDRRERCRVGIARLGERIILGRLLHGVASGRSP